MAYGDEIKAEVGRLPITGHGLLMLPQDYRDQMFADLQAARNGFTGRVHFGPLPDGGPRVETALRWFDDFFVKHVKRASFKGTFALHDGPRRLPYPGELLYQRHAVNSLRANVVGHVRYVFPEADALHLRPVHDGTGDAHERMYIGLAFVAAQQRINSRHGRGQRGYPAARFDEVTFQSSDSRIAADHAARVDAELLQLTDLLLGAMAQALRFLPTSGKLGRRRLARDVTEQLASYLKHPVYNFDRTRRHFSVSLYPDERGLMYSPKPPPRTLPTERGRGAQAPLQW